MKERLQELDEGKITGFFDKDTNFNGTLSFKGSFRIDGHFKGKINSESILIVGEQGKVNAEINVGNILINGEVKGNIHVRERAEINSKGRVFGSLISPKIVVDEGAFIEADIRTSDKTHLPEKEKSQDKKESEKKS